ncbi:hypothetical protein [Chondrinema litorale]|uniref:hypothetical protein n=1 Tax=Chondrinema litorale TaxID=2994555 RepID=UPI0025437A83|nr:hypothetical protein [Chondrinema litorale]UZR99369.1 hypothetical protein OQ292_35900 [Chondrinema litorale]
MKLGPVLTSLLEIYDKSPVFKLSKEDRLVIFSDMHMGNGKGNDDFVPNSELFLHALKEYYYPLGHKVVLNGDIEELQRFDWYKIYAKWQKIYEQFDRFAAEDRLIKTIGNHDIGLLSQEIKDYPYPLHEGIRFNYKDNDIFIFHGHQASKKYNLHNALIGYTLRYLANPLGIKNYSVSHSSRKQFKIEQNAYNFSVNKKVMSVIGHTHRPLFESLPKIQRLKYRIEGLCRKYANLDKKDRKPVKKLINVYRKELKKIYKNATKKELEQAGIYNNLLHIPCLFNSGCVIGKRGITCLEFYNGDVQLIHWFDKNISEKYLNHNGYEPVQIGDTNYYRMIIKKEKLNYIFTRIHLLA